MQGELLPNGIHTNNSSSQEEHAFIKEILSEKDVIIETMVQQLHAQEQQIDELLTHLHQVNQEAEHTKQSAVNEVSYEWEELKAEGFLKIQNEKYFLWIDVTEVYQNQVITNQNIQITLNSAYKIAQHSSPIDQKIHQCQLLCQNLAQELQQSIHKYQQIQIQHHQKTNQLEHQLASLQQQSKDKQQSYQQLKEQLQLLKVQVQNRNGLADEKQLISPPFLNKNSRNQQNHQQIKSQVKDSNQQNKIQEVQEPQDNFLYNQLTNSEIYRIEDQNVLNQNINSGLKKTNSNVYLKQVDKAQTPNLIDRTEQQQIPERPRKQSIFAAKPVKKKQRKIVRTGF